MRSYDNDLMNIVSMWILIAHDIFNVEYLYDGWHLKQCITLELL